MTRVLFLPECNHSSGMGHVTRCLALAHMLRSSFECHFVLSEENAAAVETVRTQGFEVTQVRRSTETSVVSNRDIVVLDGYSFSEASRRYFKGLAKALVCIVDNAEQHFCAQAVINHSEHAKEEAYRGSEDTQFFLGADYALLRPEFLQLAKEKARTPGRIRGALISMGGSDPRNLSLRLLTVLLQVQPDLRVEVILGPLNRAHAEIRRWLSRDDRRNVRVLSKLSGPEMVQAFKGNDLLLVTASGLAWEACAAGRVLVTCVTARNQFPIGEVLSKRKLATSIGWLEDLSDDDLASRLAAVFSGTEDYAEMVQRQKQLIDGRSPERLLRVFEDLEGRT